MSVLEQVSAWLRLDVVPVIAAREWSSLIGLDHLPTLVGAFMVFFKKAEEKHVWKIKKEYLAWFLCFEEFMVQQGRNSLGSFKQRT